MTLTGEAKRRYETQRIVSCLQRAVELLHEARWMSAQYRPELEVEGGLVVQAVEAWERDVKDALLPH